jgi:hypothetical protein
MSSPTTTIVPAFRRVDGDEPESDVNKWTASIPDTFNAAQAKAAAIEALADADKRIAAVRDAYHGTIPPSPWPATPAMRKAIDQMTGARDFFDEIGKQRPTETWDKNSKAWIALKRAGGDLYGQLDELEHNSANAPALADMLKMVPDPRTLILGFDKKKVAVAAIAAYFLIPQVKKIVRRTLGLRAGRGR